MRVLQINTVYGVKSTGRTCLETAKALRKHGHECYTAYGVGKSDDENTYKIGSEIDYYTHNILSRVTGMQGYYSVSATKGLINYINKISPDIIHLRNLHGNYLNLPLLFQHLNEINIPVVLNLHDCWAFTGKCAYYSDIECYKWKTECNKCPVLKQYPKSLFFDKTNKLHNDKRKWFEVLENLTIVGVSDWISNQARMSFLSNRNIVTIYNWINRDVFKPYNKTSFHNKYGIDGEKFIVLGVSASWTKGTARYEDFIKLSKLLDDKIQIVLVGETNEKEFPDNITHIPFVNDTEELAKLYAFSDVYVHLSTEDTFGKVVAEAMACGTPAVVYNATALPELVEEGCGYVVNPRDVRGISNAIREIERNGKAFYSSNCVKNVRDKFDYTQNIKELLSLYESILKGVS